MALRRGVWISVWVSLTVGAILAIGGLNGFYVTMRWLQAEDAEVTGLLHRIETAWGYMWPAIWFLGYGATVGLGMKVLPKMA